MGALRLSSKPQAGGSASMVALLKGDAQEQAAPPPRNALGQIGVLSNEAGESTWEAQRSD